MRNLHEKTLHLRNDRDRIMAGVILNIWGGEYHMAYQISDDCISCGVCASNCPVSAISEGDGKFVIDADTCIDCALARRIARLALRLRPNHCNSGRIRLCRMRPFFYFLCIACDIVIYYLT